MAHGTAWDRQCHQGMCSVKHPSMGRWLLPALEKWNLDRSYQPWSQRTQKIEVALGTCSHCPYR